MAETYSSRRPESRHAEREIAVSLRGRPFRFITDSGVFSKRDLDRGTELLAEAIEIGPSHLTLDLGCGYGVLGILAAALAPQGRAILTDVNARAVGLARRNVALSALPNAEVRQGEFLGPVGGLIFDTVVTNPPIRAGKEVVQRMAREARDHLVHGGTFWMVVRMKQGAPSYRKFLEATYDEVREPAKGGGYRVFAATKRL